MKILYTFFALTSLAQISFAQCDDFTVDVSYTDPLCPDYSDGSVTAMPGGGTAPYVILITDEDDFVRNPDGGAETGNLLLEGWYYIDITDDMGCTFSDSVLLVDPLEINVESYTLVHPTSIEACDGSIMINEVSGDYVSVFVSWSPDPEGISGIDAFEMTVACAGVYEVSMFSELGCAVSTEYEIGAELSVEEITSKNFVFSTNANGLIVVSDYATSVNLVVYNAEGKILDQKTLKTGSNIFTLETKGMLFYILIDSSDTVLGRGRLVYY